MRRPIYSFYDGLFTLYFPLGRDRIIEEGGGARRQNSSDIHEQNMSPKKNAFFMFVTRYKNKYGGESFAELTTKLAPVWGSMTKEEKKEYKILADNINQNRTVQKQAEQLVETSKSSSSYWKMKNMVSELFKSIPDEKELLNQNFILLHVNYHAHNGEKYYFPAEIAALHFNLSKGVSRTYHQIIGISKIYPRGYAGSMREYALNFHTILCYDEYPDDYKKILLDFLSFLKGKSDNNRTDVEGDVSNLPIMYTIETDVGIDIIKTKDSLERLYKTVFPNHKSENCQEIFKLGTAETLLYEIMKKMNLHNDQRNLMQGMSPHEVLQLDMYGCGLGCVYHELKDIAFKCSKSRVLQWMSNICKHINMLNGLPLIPGKHIAVSLHDGTRVIIENEDLPLTKFHLKVCEENYTNGENNATKRKLLNKPFSQSKLKDFLSDDDDNEDEDNTSKNNLLNKPFPQSKLKDLSPNDGEDYCSVNHEDDNGKYHNDCEDYCSANHEDDNGKYCDVGEDNASKNNLSNKPSSRSKQKYFSSDDDDDNDSEDHYFITNEEDADGEDNCSVNHENNKSKYLNVLTFQRMLNTAQEE